MAGYWKMDVSTDELDPAAAGWENCQQPVVGDVKFLSVQYAQKLTLERQ